MQSSSASRTRPRRGIVDAAPDADQARFAFGLSQADVEEFRELIHRECREDLSAEEAWTRASEVLALFRMMLGPLREDQSDGTYPQA